MKSTTGVNRFLNMLKLGDGNDEENEYLDEADDSYEEDEPTNRYIRRAEPDEDDEYVESSAKIHSINKETRSAREHIRGTVSNGSKISSIRSRSKKETEMSICVIRPHNIEEAEEVTDSLLDGACVILNLEGIEREVAMKIFYYACGSVKAVDGNLEQLSGSQEIYLLTPKNVEITGEQIATLQSAFI